VGEEEGGGELKIGHNVEIGYYAQIQEKTLDHEATVEQVIEKEATGEMAKIHRVRGLLGAFLFGSDDFDKKVKVLSGGEKSRLAIARLLLKECNLLILDEPTNHLDMSAKEVLKKALNEFDGTLILVSHDREFLQGLTDRTFEFRDGRVREHIGTIDDFLAGYKIKSFREFEGKKEEAKAQKAAAPKPEPAKPVDVAPGGAPKMDHQQRKEKEKDLKRLKNALGSLEKKIEEAEKELGVIEQQLADPNTANSGKSNDIFFQHANVQRTLDQHMQQWEKTAQEMEQLSEELSRS
jgi:ATP-binding cassette subfamily F protein 3